MLAGAKEIVLVGYSIPRARLAYVTPLAFARVSNRNNGSIGEGLGFLAGLWPFGFGNVMVRRNERLIFGAEQDRLGLLANFFAAVSAEGRKSLVAHVRSVSMLNTWSHY